MVSHFNCINPVAFYKCKICGFTSNQKIRHLFHDCGTESKSEDIYIKHMCQKCVSNSYSMLWLFLHERQHDQIKRENQCNQKADSRFKCDQCSSSFSRKSKLMIHINMNHGSDDRIKWYLCEQCGFKSKHLRNLRYHLITQHFMNKPKHQCTQCDYQTFRMSYLKLHILNKHTPDHLINWHDCHICTFRGKNSNYLNKHIKSVHLSDDQIVWFKCTICAFKSKRRNGLRKHLANKHFIGEILDKYKCSECSYSAASKANVKQHFIYKHASDDLINWYHCDFCAYKSKAKINLSRHMKTHKSDRQKNSNNHE